MTFEQTPLYFMPAEWEPQESIWLSWAHKQDSWPGKFAPIPYTYVEIVEKIAQYQKVNINVLDDNHKAFVSGLLEDAGVQMNNIRLHIHPTNDAWCRDHGAIFVRNAKKEKIALNWDYNAWGDKYPPYDLDNRIPEMMARVAGVPLVTPGIILEGGSIEVNGKGTLMTTEACLLNKNRNAHLSKQQIEEYLHIYLGIEHFLWLKEGIVGDDTDGHIDDISRFVNEDTIVTVVETNQADENHPILKENLAALKGMRQPNGNTYNVIELPMPKAMYYEGERLPASYANFLITNKQVLVPVFNDSNDAVALSLLDDCFPEREIQPIYCKDLVWGLGTLHCISQQEPMNIITD